MTSVNSKRAVTIIAHRRNAIAKAGSELIVIFFVLNKNSFGRLFTISGCAQGNMHTWGVAGLVCLL